jgi:hypothetical protein
LPRRDLWTCLPANLPQRLPDPAGRRIDPDLRQYLSMFNINCTEDEARRMLKCYPGNRLGAHLINNCVFRYGCPAAGNLNIDPGCYIEKLQLKQLDGEAMGSRAQGVTILSDRKDDDFLSDMQHVLNQKNLISYRFEHTIG